MSRRHCFLAFSLAFLIACSSAYGRDAICTCPDIELSPIDRSLPIKIVPQSAVAAHVPGPPPNYPAEARQRHLEGKGLFEVRLRADGNVSHVQMLQSTGHPLLDEESSRTFQKWNFAYLGKCNRVRIPIIYSLRPRPEARVASTSPPTTLEDAQAKELLLFTAQPSLPYEARRSRLSGLGIFDLKFDYETGRLRGINIVKSTGHSMLDGRAIGALKLWKAKPRSIHSLRVPINFSLKPLPKT